MEENNEFLSEQNQGLLLITPRERDIFLKNQKELNIEIFDKYASHKSVSQNLLNTSIVQSHIGSLVYIFAEKKNIEGFEYAAIVLIFLSLIIQTIIFFGLTWLFYRRQDYSSKLLSVACLNIIITTLSGISLMINISITVVMLEIRPT